MAWVNLFKTRYSTLPKAVFIGSAISLSAVIAQAQEEDVVELETFTAESEISDDLSILPTEPVDSIFGFGKTLLETPRSATSISIELIERYGLSEIEDLVMVSPGAFTQSFFGVAGSLDVRGTPGETYFRGIRRLDNPGNYPTAIGASDRIDIVRGPASPIYGPAKIGGYLNFVPKSARAETGQYLAEPTGEISYTGGSWDKSILEAEVGGPSTIMGKDLGYYLYFEVEDSGSYYENTSLEQTIIQASFNMDLGPNSRVEYGGMYQDYSGNENAGWNRLTQDLIDNGTYITGLAQPLDTDGDGLISHQEYGNAYITYGVPYSEIDSFFVGQAGVTDADIPSYYNLVDPGTTTIEGSQVLVSPDDVHDTSVNTFYFDYIYEGDEFSVTNKLFYDGFSNINEVAYGFAQFHDSWVIENQLIFTWDVESEGLTSSFQVAPSIRYTDFLHGSDYSNELFDRRDLTTTSGALDARLLATRIDDDYTEYYDGNYLDLGIGALADFDFDNGFNVLLGIRLDNIEVESFTPVEKLLCPIIDVNGNYQSLSANEFDIGCGGVDRDESGSTDGTSWTASLSYTFDSGITPYVTVSEQFTIIAGQGAEVKTSDIVGDSWYDTSELVEYGIKGSLMDDRLYFTLATYEQTRTDSNSQAIVTNQTAETSGTEFELRYVVNENLMLTAGYTDIEIINLNTEENGSRFSFFGAEDLTGISDPALVYGGQFIGVAFNNPVDGANKAGVPETSFNLGASYDFQNGWTTTGTYFYADETASGHTKSVILPSYSLFNASIGYSTDDWSFVVTGKNLTDERYFRANFADLFGSQIVLPELPRHFQASATFKF